MDTTKQKTAPKSTCTFEQEILLPWRSEEFRNNPYPWYDVLREKAPVYEDPLQENTFVISKYEDVVKFGKHPSLSMIAPKWVPESPWSMFKDSMIVANPPEHTALRRRSNKWFTPKKAIEWAEATRDAVNLELDKLGPQGLIEGFRNLALIPAHHAMCKAMGLPTEGFDTAAAWTHDAMVALGSQVTSEEEAKCQAAFDYLADRTNHYLEMRRKDPVPGMVSTWIDDVAKGIMTEQQLFEGVLLFWATGTPNAAYFITSGLEIFARHPEIFETWKNEPEKRHAILNEIARLSTPEISFTRFTIEPLEIRGVTIPKDKFVRFMIASANRDPEYFPEPNKVDITRPIDSAPHLTFGIGVHSCPGMIIAQTEARTVFDTLAERVKRIELAGDPIYNHDDRSAVYDRIPLRLVL